MGVLDKIKNALFEVEYVEVDEPPKKEKKPKVRDKKEKEPVKEKKKEKPIAKKIVLPGKREEKIEELEEEELKDEDFEIRPKNEIKKEKPREEFKFMDDKDFQMDQEYVPESPEILHVLDDNAHTNRDDYRKEEKKEEYSRNTQSYDYSYEQSNNQNYHSNSQSHDNRLYGRDAAYNVPVHEYGTYEKKEEKVYFKPSPIISPIYGILDKNYTKDDVKEKKEVRLTTYSRSNVSVDDIRNKAYGDEKKEEVEETKFEVEEEEDNVLVDLSDRAKPEVKEVTMGDALEYFQDLGLEYNVDYVDGSKEKRETRVKRNEEKASKINNTESETKPVKKEEKPPEIIEEKKENKIIEVADESNGKQNKEEDNDNLFDLIDSMYEEKGE